MGALLWKLTMTGINSVNKVKHLLLYEYMQMRHTIVLFCRLGTRVELNYYGTASIPELRQGHIRIGPSDSAECVESRLIKRVWKKCKQPAHIQRWVNFEILRVEESILSTEHNEKWRGINKPGIDPFAADS